MFKLRNCNCGITSLTATKIVLSIHIIVSFLVVIRAIYWLEYTKQYQVHSAYLRDIKTNKEHEARNSTYTDPSELEEHVNKNLVFVMVGVSLCFLNITFATVALAAIINNYSFLLKLYLYYHLVFILMVFCWSIAYVNSEYLSMQFISSNILLAILTPCSIYIMNNGCKRIDEMSDMIRLI